MTSKMNPKPRFVRCPKCLNVLKEPAEVPLYKCGGCGATLQAKKRNKSNIDATTQKPDDDSSGKRKMDQVFGDKEAGSSSNRQTWLYTDIPDQNSYHDDAGANKGNDDDYDIQSSNEDQDGLLEYLYGKQIKKTLTNDHEGSSSSVQQSLVNSMGEELHGKIPNDPRSSTELSGNEDPESSPEASGHNRIDQEQEPNQKHNQDHYQDVGVKQEHAAGNEGSASEKKIEQLSDDNEACSSLNQQVTVNSTNSVDQNSDHNEPSDSSEHSYHDDQDQEFLSCRQDIGFEESSSEFEEATANTRNVRGSDGSSKSSFKSLIAEKLLDTRQKKAVYLDEDDMESEDGSAALHHRRRFDRISSVETTETARYGGTGDYGYGGSVSSFDGMDNHIPRKPRIGSLGSENVDTGSRYRLNPRHQTHRLGKDELRSTDIRSLYGFDEFYNTSKHGSHVISENPKLERIELLKMVRELQDQLERTNISNAQQVPLYNNHVFNTPGRYGPRMAFSGEARAVNRRRDGTSCPHCFPQDRRFSAQLPREHVCCNGPHYGPNTYFSPRFSGPGLASPLHMTNSESEFSVAEEYRPRNDITKPVHSPKKKRYVRPIANGSPWVTCYRCSKLLELPQSFLVFNKKHHSLRCGACFKTLEFTLSNGTHVSRYYPDDTIAAPPSSEVELEDFDNLNSSRAGGPVSCSDVSFQKSYSTETDRNGSAEFTDERRKAGVSRGPSGSTRASSSKVSGRRKTTSEIEEEPRPNGSPLHRLMGYPSPSKVIRG